MTDHTLFVGIGSPHGDDRAGWLVADALAESEPLMQAGGQAEVSVRKALTPVDVLDWLDDVRRLIVCDAVRGAGSAGTLYRWRWPDASLGHVRSAGSHDVGLAAALTRAASLGWLPADVVVWGVEAGQGDAGGGLSPAVELALPGLIQLCRAEISGVASVSRVG